MSNIFDFFATIFYFYNRQRSVLEGKLFIDISLTLKKLSKFFPEHLYVVGGYVRNKILKIEGSDVDIASSVDIEEVAKRLEGSGYSVKIKNLRTGSLLISKDGEKYEYTSFRKDVYDKSGSHTPLRIERTNNIQDDAARRDFTINSIYYNINTDEVVDYYHGIIDLKDRIIRCNLNPEEVLQYDGERILRMVRIAGELDFRIDKETLAASRKFVSNVEQLSGNRRLTEIEKILYCDKRYNINSGSLKRALSILNKLGIWKYFGLQKPKLKYKLVYKVEDRFLGLLIDMVDTQKPECLESFVEGLLQNQFGFNENLAQKLFVYLAGYYDALAGTKNKTYFLKYFEDWPNIYSLIGGKSKKIQSNYNFFYQYIIENELVIKTSDLKIDESDIKKKFPNVDKRVYNLILKNLLSKVFDGKIENEKQKLLAEIKNNIEKY